MKRLPKVGEVIRITSMAGDFPLFKVEEMKVNTERTILVNGIYVEDSSRYQKGQFDTWFIDIVNADWEIQHDFMAREKFDRDLKELLK